MSRIPYSIRHGLNKNAKGFGLFDTLQLFCDAFDDLKEQGYTHEYFGFYCIDEDEVRGKISNIEREIKLVLRKSNLWPIYSTGVGSWKEDDLFDMMEFLYDRVSKPLTGSHHSYGDCGMHWVTFDAQKGKEHFVQKMNDVLLTYEKPFIMSADGLIMRRAPDGLEQIFDAKLPSEDNSVLGRVKAATNAYRRYGASIDDRRHAVSDLAGVLELLRPKMRDVITKADEADLFNIANNFEIRHQNDKQKNDYDAAIWLSWMFYFYLSTIHLMLRRLANEPKQQL